MALYRVTFQPAGRTVEADPAKFPYGRHGEPGSLLDIALAHGVEIESACGGAGACGTCHVIVTKGMKNLSEPQDAELDRLDSCPDVTPDSRLACQAVVRGDVTVTLPAWNRNTVSEQR